MAIRITSDSTCDLGEWVEKRNIGIMPLKVNLDMEEYYDGVSIQPADIFKFVSETGILPKTSAPSVFDYQEFSRRNWKMPMNCCISTFRPRAPFLTTMQKLRRRILTEKCALSTVWHFRPVRVCLY